MFILLLFALAFASCGGVRPSLGPSDWEIPGKPVWWCGCCYRSPSPVFPNPDRPQGPPLPSPSLGSPGCSSVKHRLVYENHIPWK